LVQNISLIDVKITKFFPLLVNSPHPNAWLASNLFLCNGFELCTSQEAV